jgi:AcrR family transcriptional regulator
MSKATFYEHFANKEECILALFDAAAEQVRDAVAASIASGGSPEVRIHQGVRAFLTSLVTFPDHARTLLVEVIGAGPRAAERRDQVLQSFADFIARENETAAQRYGAPRLRSPDDAYALVGAIVELAVRQLRHGRPADPLDLEPVIERLVAGVIAAGEQR